MARKSNGRPKDLATKEDLIKYLEENTNTELPFNEVVWDSAVEHTVDKERQFKEIQTTGYDGVVKTKKIPNGAVNPVSRYFQLMALPQNAKAGKAIVREQKKQKKIEDSKEREFEELIENVGDSDEGSFIRELVEIYFSILEGDELLFVVNRLSDYYTNYEFNEGSDKFLVVSVVSDELTLRDLMASRIRGRDNETKIEKVQKGYLSKLESLKVLKKQGSKLDESKNKLTMFVSELEKAGELKLEAKPIPLDEVKGLIDSFRRTVIDVFREAKI